MGGGGGKGNAPQDNSAALYAQQQADLAQQRAAQDAAEQAQRDAEAAQRDELRRQMLGRRDVLASDDEEAALKKNQLG